MIPWLLLDTAAVPGDGGALRLLRHGGDFAIKLGRHELMNSRMHASEDALAELGCAVVASRPAAHVLVGGLGMGRVRTATVDDKARSVLSRVQSPGSLATRSRGRGCPGGRMCHD